MIVLPDSDSLEAADQLITNVKTSFVPPFQLRVAPYSDGLVLQLRVTHMFSDGFSVVPLLSDLAHLVRSQELLATQPQPLPPLPVSFELLKQRIHRTIEGDHSLADCVPLETN